MFRKKLTREQFRRFMAEHPPCVVVFEACGSASYWAREMTKLGHDAKLIAPQYVKPFVKLCAAAHNLTYHQVAIMRRNVGEMHGNQAISKIKRKRYLALF